MSNADLLQRTREAQRRHTLKEVVVWGNEMCKEHHMEIQLVRRKQCPKCWQELEAEAEK